MHCWRHKPDSVIGKVLHVGVESKWFDAEGRGTPALVQDLTRVLLSLVFAFCGYLVWKAWRLKAGRNP